MKIYGAILAGGHSTRMGTNKALLPLGHGKVIESITNTLKLCSNELIIITNDPDTYAFLHLPMLRDQYKEMGPLAGIEQALAYGGDHPHIVTACDTPFISSDIYTYLLAELANFDAVVPIYKGKTHPLSGIYQGHILPIVRQQLNQDMLSVKQLLERLNVRYVTDFNDISSDTLQRHFFNMNSPAQYDEAINGLIEHREKNML